MPMWRRSTSTPYDVDFMDEDAAETTPAPAPRLCSTIAGGGDDGGVEVGLHRVDDVLAELHQAEGLVDDRSCSRPGAGGALVPLIISLSVTRSVAGQSMQRPPRRTRTMFPRMMWRGGAPADSSGVAAPSLCLLSHHVL
ncbi:hypothetical protein OsJ_06803 [Oryza sativa Japonica Group]|uniref:Uncharacterized protein n=1 Tax=Oryza sativa subsp. japonica TaxID=39947 RepID=A3A723_ORYSJ|nr:hypothetical protein OsJ_06803 [Oryza sativa Japonica Group]